LHTTQKIPEGQNVKGQWNNFAQSFSSICQ